MQKLDKLIPHERLDGGEILTIKTETAIEIITLIEGCLNFESGYGFDWEACRAAIEYFSTIAPPPAEKGGCLILGGTGRRLSRQRAGGRFSDAPHTMQDRAAVRTITGHQPVLVLSRQDGREEDGWRGAPFWWPVLFAPANAAPSVFASTVRDDGAEDEPDSGELRADLRDPGMVPEGGDAAGFGDEPVPGLATGNDDGSQSGKTCSDRKRSRK
jgi:hypothetical protein